MDINEKFKLLYLRLLIPLMDYNILIKVIPNQNISW